MSIPPYQPSKEELRPYDESLNLIPNEDRVQLPEEGEEVFTEVQSFDQAWMWTLLGIGTMVLLLSLLLAGQWGWAMIFAGAVLVMAMSVMSSFKLNTRIDDAGVHYRSHPFFIKTKTIPWEDIDQIYVRTYSPMLDYGGWGIRLGWKGWTYTIKGNQGIQIVRKNGRRVLVGTQKPDEVSQMLAHRTITV
jgi:hypothetical protein